MNVYQQEFPSDRFPSLDPAKLARSHAIENGFIYPIHAAIYPTNACNLACSFCSTKARKLGEYLSKEECGLLITILKKLGTYAITLSGGGEPTVYKHLDYLLSTIFEANMKCGLITNGAGLHRITSELLQKITWIRISLSSEYPFEREIDRLDRVISMHRKVIWGFKYVVCNDSNEQLIPISEYAAANNVSLYISQNIYEKNRSFIMPELKLPSDGSIFQNNKSSLIEPGLEKCYMGLFKPHIMANGLVYPCCGCGSNMIFDPGSALGHFRDLPKIILEQRIYNGKSCKICYYGAHNRSLDHLHRSSKS